MVVACCGIVVKIFKSKSAASTVQNSAFLQPIPPQMQMQQQQQPMQPSMEQQQYQPPQNFMANPITVDVSGLTGFQADDIPAAPAATTISGVLAVAKLEQYADALRELGCVDVVDLRDLDEADFMEIGMKKIEMKRLQRTL